MTKEITPREALDEINRLTRERDAIRAQLEEAERVIEFKDKVITAIETRAEAAEARADAAEKMAAILRDIASPGECRLDHHGYCQAHDWMATDCPHGRAREILLTREGGGE